MLRSDQAPPTADLPTMGRPPRWPMGRPVPPRRPLNRSEGEVGLGRWRASRRPNPTRRHPPPGWKSAPASLFGSRPQQARTRRSVPTPPRNQVRSFSLSTMIRSLGSPNRSKLGGNRPVPPRLPSRGQAPRAAPTLSRNRSFSRPMFTPPPRTKSPGASLWSRSPFRPSPSPMKRSSRDRTSTPRPSTASRRKSTVLNPPFPSASFPSTRRKLDLDPTPNAPRLGP